MAAATRRASTSTRDGSDHGAVPPSSSLGQAHRRMSRVEPGFAAHAARRMSVYRRPSLAGSQRTDLSHPVAAPVKLQNTYRLHPDDDEKFKSSRASEVLREVLVSFLEGEDYEAAKCTALARSVADVMKERLKDMGWPRYKFVCHVLIGEKANQAIRAASRCVWNTDTDNFAEATFENSSLFAVASAYGCYFE